MIKLKNIVGEIRKVPAPSSRRREINHHMVKRLLQTNYSEAFKSYQEGGATIRRNLNIGGDSPYYFINPKSIERSSKEAKNFYTTLVSMLPSWKNYPKRTRSVIALTNTKPPSDYGKFQYYIFPLNGAKLAVSSTDDFWYGGPYLRNRTGHSMITFTNSFPDFLGRAISMNDDVIDGKIDNVLTKDDIADVDEKTYGEMISKLDSLLTMDVLKKLNPALFYSNEQTSFKDVLANFKGSWEQYFDDLLNPESNEVHLKNITEISNTGGSHECWTDAPCVLIEHGYVEVFDKELSPTLTQPEQPEAQSQ